MAVIRQTTQFVNKPVGVVRASEGGQGIAQAISSGASALANEFYREAAVVAQETGQKEAMAQSSEDIVSIDPETGNPVAYKAPDSYGSIASRAYQGLIDRRFQESLMDEIQEKGSELASSVGSAAAYKAKMSQYIGEMYKSAVSEDGDLNSYGRQIKEAGEAYVASTYATLRKKEIAAYKKRIKDANELEAYRAQERIQQGIAAGQDPEVLRDQLRSEAQRNKDMLAAGGSVSKFITMQKKIDAQRDLIGANELVGIYSSSSDEDRLKIEQAILDPSRILQASSELGLDRLGLLIAQSGGRGGAASILSGLRAVGQVEDTMDTSDAEQAVSELNITLDSILPALEASINAKNISSEAKQMALQDMYQSVALKGLDASNLSALDMSVIANELQSENFLLSKIKNVTSLQYYPNVVLAVNRMGSEQRSELASLLTDRQADLTKIETAAEQDFTSGIRMEIVELENSESLTKDYLKIQQRLMNSGATNAQTLLGNLDENMVEISLQNQRNIPVSADEFDNIKSAVLTGGVFKSKNLDANKIFGLLSDAYKISPTTVSGEISRRSGQLNSNAKERVESSILSSIEAAARAGKPLQKSDLDKLDESIFKGKPLFLVDINQYPSAVDMFNAGTVLPSVRRAMSLALDSNSEEEIEAGAIMFRQGSTASSKLPSGEVTKVDLMRSALSVEDYSLYQSLMYANSMHAEDPTTIVMLLRNYDGNLNEDLMKDFGKTGSDLLKILEGGPAMSPQYKREIIASLKVAKARGGRITQDTLDRLISNYEKYTVTDESVIGPRFGDGTVYGRLNFFNQSEIFGNKAALTDALVDSGRFDDLLTGGTITDSMLASFQELNPLAFVFSSLDLGASMFGDLSRMEKTQARNRIKEGLAAIDVPLLYRPNVQSFNNGVPSFDVGYDDGFGFEPITINGNVWTLTKDSGPSLSGGDLRYQNLRQLNNAVRANAPLGQVYSAEINYLSTLEHMTLDILRAHKLYPEFKRVMDQDPDEFFIDARKKYEDLR